jgi:hypothetical protein
MAEAKKRTLILDDGSEVDVVCGDSRCEQCDWQHPCDGSTVLCRLFGRNHRCHLLGRRSNACLAAERKGGGNG